MKIIKEKIVFNDIFTLEKAELNNGKNTFSKMRVNRPDASAVLVLNTDKQCFILTKQFRYAIAAKTRSEIFEIVAGKIDPGETPLAAAIRETEEEVGYKVKPENIKELLSGFVSPGYTSEKFHIYFASVTNEDKINSGGGMENENESIEVVEIPVVEFDRMITEKKIEDIKTYVAALHYKLAGGDGQ